MSKLQAEGKMGPSHQQNAGKAGKATSAIERADRQARANQISQRAASRVVETIQEEKTVNQMVSALGAALGSKDRRLALKAVELALKIEKDERELQLREEEVLEGRTHNELLEMLARDMATLTDAGVIPAPVDTSGLDIVATVPADA